MNHIHSLKTWWLKATDTRRKRRERHMVNLLWTARDAARKLKIEYSRGSVEKKAEYDYLIAAIPEIDRVIAGEDAP